MTLFKNKYRIESIRVPGYDYSQSGHYFITICTYNRGCIFGEIVDDKMKLSSTGIIVKKFISEIKQYFINVEINEYIIMPNHIHMIIIIKKRGGICDGRINMYCMATRRDGVTPSLRGLQSILLKKKPQIPPAQYQPTLGQIVGYYKYQTTKQINQLIKTIGIKIWQRNYYEHIIRNEQELFFIREYIKNNPKNWIKDRNNI